ncbi:MAG: FimV family protein, partial [Woeseiaceae bacterium]
MSLNHIRVWPLLVLAFTSEVWALGLGDIRLSSALNEPLRAEIDLLSATPEELDNLDVLLASSETFERYGLDRPLFLQDIEFSIVSSGGVEGNVIRVTSDEPVTEPFITFLVEATWSRGRLLREYTVLLDPPTFAPPPVAESTTAVTAPRQTTEADSGRIERPSRPEPAPSRPERAAPPPPAERPAPTFDTTAGGDYQVQRGETLWSITQQVRPDSRLTINQTMLAIFEANPQAFAGNINILSAGATLRIPSADEIFSINRNDAFSEVRRQNEAWRGVAPSARTEPSLVLVPPDDDAAAYDGGVRPSVTADADAAAAERIRQLEQQIADQNSLLEIRDNELAALRAELARLRGEEVVEPLDADADAALDEVVEPIADEDATVAADETADIGVEDVEPVEVTEPDAVTPTQPPRVVSAPTREEPGIVARVIDTLTGFWGILIGGLIVVLGVLVWFARRAARGEDEESTGVWDALDADDMDGESLASTERLRALAQDDETAIVVQETAPVREEPEQPASAETIEVPLAPEAPAAEPEIAEATGEQVQLEDTFSSETAINLDQSDPIAEAEFHMAYGLYDQAADLINGALAVEPERQDLLSKLCEIYFVWGNRDAFVDAADRLRTTLAEDSSPDWDKIV